MVGPEGGKEEPPLSSFSISSSASQVLSWELLPQREGHVDGSQAREQDPELCPRALGAHCCGVSWGSAGGRGQISSLLGWLGLGNPLPFSLSSALSGLEPSYSPSSEVPHTPPAPSSAEAPLMLAFWEPHPHGNTQRSSRKQTVHWKEGTQETRAQPCFSR